MKIVQFPLTADQPVAAAPAPLRDFVAGSSLFGDTCLHKQTMTITWLAEAA